MESSAQPSSDTAENLDGNQIPLPTKSSVEEREIDGEKMTFYRTDAILGLYFKFRTFEL